MRTVILMRIIIFVLLMLPTIIFAQAAGFDATKLLAEQGHVEAQYNLGLMYASGDGVPENDAEAVKWFRLSSRTRIRIGSTRFR